MLLCPTCPFCLPFLFWITSSLAFNLAIESYFQKIALSRQEITSNVSMAQTINHISALIVPVVGGILWEQVSPSATFLAGVGIAVISLVLVQFIRTASGTGDAGACSGRLIAGHPCFESRDQLLGEITMSNDLDQLCVNTIRTLAMDGVQKAKSGHPGLPMGMADAAYVLWTRFLKHNPADPAWPDRDRFVLSAGHGSMLLYSLLYLTGYDLPLEQLKQFRQWGSMTPGHPEYGDTPGVETTTGPLGQGFATGVGMALAEQIAGRPHATGPVLRWWTITPMPSSATAT